MPVKFIKIGGASLQDMVSAVSRSANSQNTVQPADFSANDPFHVAVEEFANNTWLPDGTGRWFYERARGSYGAAEFTASGRAAEKKRFAKETPKDRRFSKTDLAKYLNAWNGLPHLVSFGNQKNFQHFMQALKEEHPDGFKPDAAWYRAFIAKGILFCTVQSMVRAAKFPAYQANITAYTVAALSWRTGGRIDFERIWSQQALSPELRAMPSGMDFRDRHCPARHIGRPNAERVGQEDRRLPRRAPGGATAVACSAAPGACDAVCRPRYARRPCAPVLNGGLAPEPRLRPPGLTLRDHAADQGERCVKPRR